MQLGAVVGAWGVGDDLAGSRRSRNVSRTSSSTRNCWGPAISTMPSASALTTSSAAMGWMSACARRTVAPLVLVAASGKAATNQAGTVMRRSGQASGLQGQGDRDGGDGNR